MKTTDFRNTQTYTHLHMEAATCLWEAMLERRDGTLKDAFEFLGTVEMRHHAINLADDALKVWDALTEEEKEQCIPYDWEFIPAFLNHVEIDTCGAMLHADHRDVALSILGTCVWTTVTETLR